MSSLRLVFLLSEKLFRIVKKKNAIQYPEVNRIFTNTCSSEMSHCLTLHTYIRSLLIQCDCDAEISENIIAETVNLLPLNLHGGKFTISPYSCTRKFCSCVSFWIVHFWLPLKVVQTTIYFIENFNVSNCVNFRWKYFPTPFFHVIIVKNKIGTSLSLLGTHLSPNTNSWIFIAKRFQNNSALPTFV